MDKTLFETRAISIFHDRKFVFYDELQKGVALNKMSLSEKTKILAAEALAGFGAFVINFSSFTDNDVKPELERLAGLCDLMGVKLSTSVNLVLFIYGDNLADDAIIGKCHLIHDRLSSFKKFAMRFGWVKYPVRADVFFAFNDSEKAFHFRNSVQAYCKHYPFLRKIWVLPWGIDLTAKSVWTYQGLPVNLLKPKDIEIKLFS
jgi:hypothetical protein